ncbi:MAG: putative membrane protein [Arenicella sp.]|jgi:putative membrane protein
MYVQRVFNPISMIGFSIKPIIIFTLYASGIVALYQWHQYEWLKIPWVPLTLVGIAVAFYIGFKNNSAYDRTWEARKIWGGIVNSSRSWGAMVNGFVTNEFAIDQLSEEELKEVRRKLIYRHIAWLYRLKRQLRVIKEWEHDKRMNKRYRVYINELFPNEDPDVELKNFLDDKEVQEILDKKNGCTQLLHKQTEELRDLKGKGLIDDFRHMEMQGLITEFYTLQGKCERIKNFPLPRQYASLSIYFVYIFIFLMPLGLLSAFDDADLAGYMIWGVVPFTTLIGWVFWMMEGVGDYAENPFENLAFDTPMTSLTRTIEIDLKEMLGETELPPAIGPKDGFVI